MDLKVRFTVFFSLVMLVFLGAFTLLIYSQMRAKLLGNAQQNLASHLEHEFHHVEQARTSPPTHDHGVHLKEIHQRVWRDGVVIEDSFPATAAIAEPKAGPEIHENRVVASLERIHNGHLIKILAYRDLSSTLHYLSTLRTILAIGLLLAIALIVPMGFISTKLLLRPFDQLANRAAELDAQSLAFRFEETGRRDEYGILVRTFNSLLKRLENSFAQARRFATNASHELRTPLAVIISQGEKALRKPRNLEEYRETLEKMLSQARNLNRITSRLLTLADIESSKQDTQRGPIQVDVALNEIVQALAVVSGEKEKSVIVEQATGIMFRGNLPTLNSILTNLIENALKFASSRVVVKLANQTGALRIDVEDDGPGIAFDKRKRVFEPFYHDSLGTQRKGHGLGLTIVKACVDSYQGTVDLGDSALGGLLVTVQLPEMG